MGDRDYGRESGGKHGIAFGGIVSVFGCYFVFALTCDEWREWMGAPREHPYISRRGLDNE